MRKLRSVLGLWAVVPLLAATWPSAAYADFDPSGRNRPKPKPVGGVPTGNPGNYKPPAPVPKPTPEEERSPEALIQRYTGIVLSQPGVPFPLQRLAQLYRERDGNLKKLVEELETKSADAGPDAWSAKIALAGIYKIEGRHEDAIATYEAAIAEKPDKAAPLQALAQLKQDRGDVEGAQALFEQALPLLSGMEAEQTRRTLMGLALDAKDWPAAKAHHDELVKAAQGSMFVRAELGQALMARNEFERAETEFREVVKAAAGDNRALAPAYRDLGKALARQNKTDEALDTLQKALSVAGGATGVRREILFIMADAFRAQGKLPELIAILEKEPGQDFERLAMLGALYEETGNVEQALSTYRKALGINSRHIDTRVRLVHLLQTAGELEEAIKEYEALIKAAPHNAEFVFELCETLIQRGDRPKALRLLEELEGRSTGDPEILAAVADFYERVEEKDRALALLKRIAGSGGSDPHFLIDLGDRYYQAGEKEKAMETWARIKGLIPDRARSAATLGEVYLDHDMPAEALASLREAVKLEPRNDKYKKVLAIALERTATSQAVPAANYNEARAIWEELLKNAGKDDLLAREARTHIVSLWALTKDLSNRVTPLQAKFESEPPDLEAGRLLAEVQRKLHKLPEAETTLRRLVELAPGDEQSLLALERVLVQQHDLKGAIAVLEKLAEVNPKRARQYYQRMAQYAAELYLDDDAIRYAAKAVELSPDDASGHEKLADMYRRRQDYDKAIAEYRAAISKNDRLFPVYFDLAELLLTTGEVDEADRLFRRVVRSSRDEELVSRAARLSMQINLGKGSLATLERELLPVAVGNPQKPIYRRLLVELYGAMTFPLVQRIRLGSPDEAKAARTELTAIGTRAVKPLLDALGDDNESQQRIAIEVLAYVQNKSAAPTLFNFATGSADKSLRVRAMVAAGALNAPDLLPRLEGMLAPPDGSAPPSDAVAVAAAWAVARQQSPAAQSLLVKLIEAPSPDVRAIAAVGLGVSGNGKHRDALLRLAASPEAGATARAAAFFALAELGQGALDPALVEAAMQDRNRILKKAALLSAARLAPRGAADDATLAAIASSVFSPDPELRQGAVSAATTLATGSYPRAQEPLSVPDGPVSATGVLAGLEPAKAAPAERAAALEGLAGPLTQAAVAAVSTSPERALVVADALSSDGAVSPFLSSAEMNDHGAAVAQARDRIAAAVVTGFVALVRHPSVDVRTRAVEFLAGRDEPQAQAAVIDALGDPNEEVQRGTLLAVRSSASAETVSAIADLAVSAESWPTRVGAAEALGRLGAAGSSPPELVKALRRAATEDEFALVREAALQALAKADPSGYRATAEDRKASDPEPRVRMTATKLLGK